MGYSGAIGTGQTICGFLFAGAIYLGVLHGQAAAEPPEVRDNRRLAAIGSVKKMFSGFIARFGATDCHALSGCDFSQAADSRRYYRDKVYEKTCFIQLRYVIETCLQAGGS